MTGVTCVILTAQLIVITFNLLHEGSPIMAGPWVYATYHFDWILIGFAPLPSLHVSGHLRALYCRMGVPLYVVRWVVLVSNPIGSPL